jgi:hypothetical protein
LNTNTVNYQELVGNGRTYKVPHYQHDYSWREEQWEDLWQDIDELRADAATRHYMGAIVVKAESDRQFLIIDGQQRIATPAILALACISVLRELAQNGVEPEKNEARAQALRARFVGEKDPASLTEISKLLLNSHDDGVFEVLKQIYVQDPKFQTDFAQMPVATRGLRRRLAKYILAKLEADLSSRDIDYETDPATIEHILPENPQLDWDSMFPENYWEEATDRLGNLSLLEASLNRQVGNAPFAEKLRAYEGSRYSMAKSIAENSPEDWTPAALDMRQAKMANRAVHIWRASFDD